jgi:hypothetical protein
MRTSQQIIADLEELSSLENNWDGDGAVAPVPDVLATVCDLIQSKRCPDRILPRCDGAVVVEWFQSRDHHVSATIAKPGRIQWRQYYKGGVQRWEVDAPKPNTANANGTTFPAQMIFA